MYKYSVKISKCFLNFLTFLICNKAENDAFCKFVCFSHIAGKMAASDSNIPDEKMNEVCLRSLFLLFISTVYYNTVSYLAASGQVYSVRSFFCSHLHFEIQLELN